MRRSRVSWIVLLLAAAAVSTTARSQDEEKPLMGFSEPYRTVRLAANDAGIIAELHVREGSRVQRGDLLATLDMTVHDTLLQIAKAGKDAEGEVHAAKAEQELRAHRLRLVKQLFADKHATDDELWRAQTELSQAEATLRAAQEKKTLRSLEFDKIAAQIESRRLRAPVAGVITSIHKQPGEYVGPTDPVVMTLV